MKHGRQEVSKARGQEMNEAWRTGSEGSMVDTSRLESDVFPCTVSGAQTALDPRPPSLNLLYCINNLFL